MNNLLLNAVKYSLNNSHIIITLKQSDSDSDINIQIENIINYRLINVR